jgi:NitT/TauT family transport system substrate-binding protein
VSNSLDRRTVIASGAAALFAAGARPRAARSADLVTLKIGTLTSDNTATVYYAQELGIFKKYGIDAQISAMQSGPAVAAAVIGGALDVGVANVATIAIAHTRGVAIKFLFPASIASETELTDQIMVAKDSPITNAAGMNGKTVGVNGLRDLQQLCAMSWVDKHGGDSKTLKFVEIPIPQMAAAIDTKRVDVGMPVEPFVTASLNAGVTKSLGNVLDGLALPYMIIGWLATDSWLQKNGDVAKRFIAAMKEAALWGNAHHKESAEIIGRIYKLDPTVLPKMNRATYGTALEARLLQPVLDGALKYGILPSPVAPADLMWTPT